MNWMDYFSNPRGHYFKKSMFDILQERYHQNEAIVERMSVALPTETDITQFMKLIADVYEAAYMKAVNDHKEQLQKMGLAVKIVSQKSKEG